MKMYRADLHIHTVLSPCGSLEMSPEQIVEEAIVKGLDMIAITDHNSTRQCKAVIDAGRDRGLKVIGGAEVNTREEVHCLTLFEDIETLNVFQAYLDEFLPDIPNDPDTFGHQVWVNRKEEIEGEETRLLLSGLEQSIEDVERKVHSLDGLFIPAHVDRPMYGIYSQLGFIPDTLHCDALEVSANAKPAFFESTKIREQYPIISNSDAHHLDMIGNGFTTYLMENPTFIELKKAINSEEGRKTLLTFNS